MKEVVKPTFVTKDIACSCIAYLRYFNRLATAMDVPLKVVPTTPDTPAALLPLSPDSEVFSSATTKFEAHGWNLDKCLVPHKQVLLLEECSCCC